MEAGLGVPRGHQIPYELRSDCPNPISNGCLSIRCAVLLAASAGPMTRMGDGKIANPPPHQHDVEIVGATVGAPPVAWLAGNNAVLKANASASTARDYFIQRLPTADAIGTAMVLGFREPLAKVHFDPQLAGWARASLYSGDIAGGDD